MTPPVKVGNVVRIPKSRYYRGEYRVVGVTFGALGEVELVDLDIGRDDGRHLCEYARFVEVVREG
jgi:hypothetical protein